jgi:hypothetical protein
MRLARLLAVAALLGGVVMAFEAEIACTRALPGQICTPAEVVADVPSPTDIDASKTDCTSCIETPCCDDIGPCDVGCRTKVRNAHACVLDAGRLGAAAAENRCVAEAGVGAIGSPENNAYGCMRRTCGETCGLPVCQVDRSFGQFLNKECDECLSRSCCAEINFCGQDRLCKILLDCAVQNCKSLFGKRTAAITPQQLAFAGAAICNGQQLAPLDDGGDDCVQKCFAASVTSDVPPGPSSPGCIGFGVVSCAFRADCQKYCNEDFTDAN